MTPCSPPEQRNRTAEHCYINARARKRAETKKNSLLFVDRLHHHHLHDYHHNHHRRHDNDV